MSLAFLSSFFFFCFLGPHLPRMEVPRLGVEWELQVPAYTTATAMQDLSLLCGLHHSSRQHQIHNPLIEARDRTRNLLVPRRIRFCCATMTTLSFFFLATLQHLEVPRPGIRSKPQLQQHWIQNPLCHSGSSSLAFLY